MKGSLLLMAMHFVLCHNLGATGYTEKDSTNYKGNQNSKHSFLNVLDGGHIGVLSNGNLRSSTNIFRFNVGHPKHFHLPFYLNVGANINLSIAGSIVNEGAAVDLLNDMGGMINFGVNGKVPIQSRSRTTKLFGIYHLALKSITGIGREDALSERFLSKVISLGFGVKSKAWSPNNPVRKGFFWLKNSISVSDNPSKSIAKLWGENTDDFFVSHSLEAGIKLEGGIDIKFSLFHFLNNKSIKLISSPIMKLGTNVQF